MDFTHAPGTVAADNYDPADELPTPPAGAVFVPVLIAEAPGRHHQTEAALPALPDASYNVEGALLATQAVIEDAARKAGYSHGTFRIDVLGWAMSFELSLLPCPKRYGAKLPDGMDNLGEWVNTCTAWLRANPWASFTPGGRQ